MVTVKAFRNVAEAGYAHSLLESIGLHPFLLGEYGFTAEPGLVDEIRLQVPEDEADAARKILFEGEGLTPLPDDFVPPTDEPSEDARATRAV